MYLPSACGRLMGTNSIIRPVGLSGCICHLTGAAQRAANHFSLFPSKSLAVYNYGYGRSICAPPPKWLPWNPNPQCGGFGGGAFERQSGIDEVVRDRHHHGISVLMRPGRDQGCGDTQESDGQTISGPSLNPTMLASRSWTSLPPELRNKCLLFKLPGHSLNRLRQLAFFP